MQGKPLSAICVSISLLCMQIFICLFYLGLTSVSLCFFESDSNSSEQNPVALSPTSLFSSQLLQRNEKSNLSGNLRRQLIGFNWIVLLWVFKLFYVWILFVVNVWCGFRRLCEQESCWDLTGNGTPWLRVLLQFTALARVHVVSLSRYWIKQDSCNQVVLAAREIWQALISCPRFMVCTSKQHTQDIFLLSSFIYPDVGNWASWPHKGGCQLD